MAERTEKGLETEIETDMERQTQSVWAISLGLLVLFKQIRESPGTPLTQVAFVLSKCILNCTAEA